MSCSRVMAPGALLVWSVEKTRWPVSEAWIAVSAVSLSRISPIMTTSGSWRRIGGGRGGRRARGGLRVADLADHDAVGVVAEDRAEAGGEVQADFVVDLDLVDAG